MQWKQIKNFPNYAVSSTGLVKNTKFNRLLSFSIRKGTLTSYLRVTLFKKGERYYKQVHRLVAEAFLENCFNKPQIDHINGDGTNNRVENLRWVTCSENIKHSFVTRPEIKHKICSDGGKTSSVTIRKKAIVKYKNLLGTRFVDFHNSGVFCKDASVTYLCECGIKRTASVMWKELRKHKGKCPSCTNTINRSSESLICH